MSGFKGKLCLPVEVDITGLVAKTFYWAVCLDTRVQIQESTAPN